MGTAARMTRVRAEAKNAFTYPAQQSLAWVAGHMLFKNLSYVMQLVFICCIPECHMLYKYVKCSLRLANMLCQQ